MIDTRPVWAEISRRKLIENFRLLERLAAPDAALLAVVKANAYGHGAAVCGAALAAEGARWFGVTCVEEGIALRAALQQWPEARILIMSGIWRGEAGAAIEHRLTPAVWESFHLVWLEEEARRRDVQNVPVFVEVDTGMSRQGVRTESLPALLDRFAAAPRLQMEGVMTHFHSPEELENPATEKQAAVFQAAVETIAARGIKPAILSAGNSANALVENVTATVANLARAHGARFLVRPGISLYGYPPHFSGANPPPGADALKPVLSWKAQVISLRAIERGETAGYNATFRAEQPTRLALLPVGYADGLNRLLSGTFSEKRGHVLIRGRRAPIAGRVSMDQIIVDVSAIPDAAVGDEAMLIGQQGSEQITAADIARLIGTIPYEVLCAIGARVPRLLID